jgi:hypothetical protein
MILGVAQAFTVTCRHKQQQTQHDHVGVGMMTVTKTRKPPPSFSVSRMASFERSTHRYSMSATDNPEDPTPIPNFTSTTLETDTAIVSSTDPSPLKVVDIQFEPVPNEVSSTSNDWFTYILVAYGIFAITDSIFHFIPNDKTYVEMLKDAIL